MDLRKKRLLNDTLILTIGSFSSKFLTLLLIPLYSFYFSASEFGEYDIYITFASMLYIFFSFQSVEAGFRFIQDVSEDRDKKKVITNSFAIAIIGIIIYSITLIIFDFYFNFIYTTIFFFYVSTSIISNLFLHTMRGLGYTKQFAIIGIYSTLITIIINIIFIIVLKYGAIALLITPIVVNIAIIFLTLLHWNFFVYISKNNLDLDEIKVQLRYSIPLIPNALSLWLFSSIGRFVLIIFYSTSTVGLFAFAMKFPMLLATVSSIFFMAWQLAATKNYQANKNDKFEEEIFDVYSGLMIGSLFIILPIIKITYIYLIGDDFKDSWLYVPFFFMGILFKSFAQFFEISFMAAKRTSEVFMGTFIAALLYLILSLLLVSKFYIFGVGIAFVISEIIHFIFIKKRSNKIKYTSINKNKLILRIIFLILWTILFYIFEFNYQFLFLILGILMFLYINFNVFILVLKSLNKIIKNKLKKGV
ncbi:lipopolysaccharide biosynthesis protein [Chryseomicrobium imtechense]